MGGTRKEWRRNERKEKVTEGIIEGEKEMKKKEVEKGGGM